MDKTERLLRFPAVKELTGLSRTTVWRKEKEGTFPKRLQLSERLVAWKESDVLSWLEELEVVN